MDATLKAVKRETRGKNEARRLRVAGQIPAVLYGGAEKDGALALAVEPKVLSRILHSETGVNTLIDLDIDGEAPTKVLVKEFQLNPITHHLLHADFYRVAMDKVLTLSVNIEVVGEAPGVKVQGGVLDFVTRSIEIEVLPTQIPDTIRVDVSELALGQSIRVRDLAKDAPWTPVTDADVMVVHVVALRAEAEPAAADAAAVATPGATAEPEVIKKGKTEKDE